MLKVLNTTSFLRTVKKLHTKEKLIVDEAVNVIATEIPSGEEKKGDLSGVFVYKFKMNKQDVLLAYRLNVSKHNPQEVVLLAFGSRENFYSYLKNEVAV
jgi:mRNA-degrading endonuclease RelE of RelBE toxin-antitoxin system